MKAINEGIYIVILIIAWIIPSLLSSEIKCKVKYCTECYESNSLTCKICYNNYKWINKSCIFKDRSINLEFTEYLKNDIIKTNKTTITKSKSTYNPNKPNSLNKPNQKRTLTEKPLPKPVPLNNVNCGDNCIKCYNTDICQQCSDLNWFVGPDGKCELFERYINCKKDKLVDGKCQECRLGFTMNSKIGI